MEKKIEEPQTAAPADHEKVVSASAPPKGARGMYSSAPFAHSFVGASRHRLPSKVSVTHKQDESK